MFHTRGYGKRNPQYVQCRIFCCAGRTGAFNTSGEDLGLQDGRGRSVKVRRVAEVVTRFTPSPSAQAKPSRRGPTAQGRSSGRALHLAPWGVARSPEGGPTARHGRVARRVRLLSSGFAAGFSLELLVHRAAQGMRTHSPDQRDPDGTAPEVSSGCCRGVSSGDMGVRSALAGSAHGSGRCNPEPSFGAGAMSRVTGIDRAVVQIMAICGHWLDERSIRPTWRRPVQQAARSARCSRHVLLDPGPRWQFLPRRRPRAVLTASIIVVMTITT
jgi:hypothetical protein